MKQLSIVFLTFTLSGQLSAAKLIKLDKTHQVMPTHSLMAQSTPRLKVIKQSKGHIRYQQLINGIPVHGYHVIHHGGKKDGYYSGHWINPGAQEQYRLSANPQKVNAKTALDIAKQHYKKQDKGMGQDAVKFTQESSNLHYIINNDSLKAVYVVSFFADSQKDGHPSRPFYLIDANNKSVIKHWEGLTTNKVGTGPGGNEKTGRYEYGVDYPKLDVTIEEDSYTCAMSNNNVETINLNHTFDGDMMFEFQCPYHSNDDEINGGYSALNDAHYFGGVIFNMYKEWYDTTPLTFKLKMRVHYGENFENAFWDGSSMTFGDGDTDFYPLVSIDVAAHEVSHGFTEQNSGLEYWGQSGGLNESFSDMAGKAAEYYFRGHNTWNIGEDITKGQYPLRYMDRPEKDGTSIGDARDFDQSLDVHFSSGVFNRLFYTLATSNGWDTRKAFEIMVKANQHYWEPETNFTEAAEGIIHAAQDLN